LSKITNEYHVSDINGSGDIILPEKDFRRFINSHALPIFKYEYETETHRYKTTFTVFHGVHVCLKTEISQRSPKV